MFCPQPLIFNSYLLFQVETLAEIRENILATDSNKAPSRFINDYAVMELLGSGAFGAVYKVKKKTAGQSFLAMKEVSS